MSREREFDIRANADEVARLARQGQAIEALRLLEQRRAAQPPAIQEALDRYVVAFAGERIAAEGQAARRVGLGPALDRLDAARGAPRLPDHAAEVAHLGKAQQYDIYASIVRVRGNEASARALDRAEERVILGLRQETDTRASATRREPDRRQADDPRTPFDESSRGTGVYDDRIVVLWTDVQGRRDVFTAEWANTEPTAQYDQRAGRGRRAAAPGFESVEPRRIQGEDANHDGVLDLGRLREGVYEMQAATHPVRGNPHDRALRPTAAAVENGAGQVERDTNGDGRFTAGDVDGIQDLNNTFKIHRGSRDSTDSAGCQTIHTRDYKDFMDAVRGNPRQTTWQYVLTSTRGGGELQQRPVRVPPPFEGERQAHPLLEQARERVRALDESLGRAYDAVSERLAGALAVAAREQGLSRIDQVVLSRPTATAGAGEYAFAVQGNPANPAALRAGVRTEVAVATPVEQSVQRLQAFEREPVRLPEHALAHTHATQEAPRLARM